MSGANVWGVFSTLELLDHLKMHLMCAGIPSYVKRIPAEIRLTHNSELPSNLVLKKLSPKIWLPLLTSVWGALTLCLGFLKGFGSFVGVRALLGVAEGGLLPGMVLYLSHFYRREELALRIGIFYTAASLSGAFGGLLARGLSAIGPAGGLEGWRWIFIIEGLITVACGIVSWLALPNSIQTARFLQQHERDFAQDRLGHLA